MTHVDATRQTGGRLRVVTWESRAPPNDLCCVYQLLKAYFSLSWRGAGALWARFLRVLHIKVNVACDGCMGIRRWYCCCLNGLLPRPPGLGNDTSNRTHVSAESQCERASQIPHEIHPER